MFQRMGWLALAGVVMLAGAATAAEVAADAELKPYEKVAGVSGTINSVGSDTLNNLMQQWAEGFKKHYPNVAVQIEGKGSATAPPALTEGIAQLGPMSRAMKDTEIEAFEKKHGFKPTRVGVALDCLAVYVHKDNPVRGLTMPQVDCIFSSTRKSGFRDIATWGGVHLTGEWAERPISLYGRDTASGTYGFFKEHALNKGDFKDSVKQQPGSAGVVNGVANDIAGIGYSGIGYKTADVRALPLAKGGDDPLVEPTFENALAGKYPLGRTLYIYVSKKPSEPLPLHIKEFLKFTLSREGQEIVVKDGFGALPLKVVANQLKAVE